MKSGIFESVCVDPVAVLRNEPNSAGSRVDEFFSGMTATVIERAEGWLLVETSYGYRGWVEASSIAPSTRWSPDLQVMRGFADVMSEPKYQGLMLETLPAGARVRSDGQKDGGWIRVLAADGKTGWMRESFLAAIPSSGPVPDESLFRASVVATARSFLGTQYRWGGKTANGIDCSGLCSLSYLLNGAVIFRDAVFKSETFREIPFSRLKPGDLVYFPGHVGMYVGDNRVIHSTAALSGVVLNSLSPGDADYRAVLADSIEHCGTIFWQDEK